MVIETKIWQLLFDSLRSASKKQLLVGPDLNSIFFLLNKKIMFKYNLIKALIR